MFSFKPSQGSGDFICFIGDLKKELNDCARYVKEIPGITASSKGVKSCNEPCGLLCVSLHSVPTISVCCRVPGTSTCCFYSLELTKEIVKEHMEEDLELYNDNGLDGFGQMLGCALKSSLHFSNTTDTDADSSFFPLQLTYRIASNELVGTLKIPLRADNMNAAVINFMFDIKESAATKVPISCCLCGSKRSHDDNGISNLTANSVETGESTEQHSEVLNNNTKTTAAPSNVKSRPKKRVGGVSLNPSKRKKK